MSALFLYLIKANIALCLFYLAYRFGLRRLTFYTINRWFLLTGIAFSSIFPLVDVNDFVNRHETLAQQVVIYLPDLNAWQQPPVQTFTFWNFMEWVFWAGVAVMFIRLMVQMASLLFLHAKTSAAEINDKPVRLMGSSMNPFSFFRHIYVNPSLHSPEELQAILQHESIHVKEWHSADVLMSEINNVFYWFNPGAWLMKTAIRENLEFLTDRTMLRAGVDRKAYQYSLVQVNAAQYAAGITNNFNFSHIKNRIKMMNKQRSSRLHLSRYAVLGCMVCVAVLSLNFTKAGTAVHNVVKEVQEALVITDIPRDTVVPAKPKEVIVVEGRKKDSYDTIRLAARAVKGQVASIRIDSRDTFTTVTGKPTPVIRLVSRASVSDSSGQPLVVIDGVPVLKTTNPLQDLNANDIESITVLKDASAAAIYGTAGNNGVILVTTRKTRSKDTPEEVVVVGYGTKQKAAADSIRFTAENVIVVEGKPKSKDNFEAVTVTGYPTPVKGNTVSMTGKANVTSNTATVSAVKVYPNPSGGIYNITFNSDKIGSGYIEVTDVNGKPVYRKNINGFSGAYSDQLDLGRFPSGTYFVSVVRDGVKTVNTIVKK